MRCFIDDHLFVKGWMVRGYNNKRADSTGQG